MLEASPDTAAGEQLSFLNDSCVNLEVLHQKTASRKLPGVELLELQREGGGDARAGMKFAVASGICFSVWPIACSIVEGKTHFGNFLQSARLGPESFFILYATSAL